MAALAKPHGLLMREPLHDSDTRRRCFAAMRDFIAYLDASGTHEGSPVVGFTGILSTAHMWTRFSKNWNAALARSPKPVAVFHMNDFYGAYGRVFGGWSRDERQQLISQLAPMISNAAILAFGILLRVADYERYLSPRASAVYKRPEDLCFEYALSQVRNWIVARNNLAPGERIRLVIDRDQPSRMKEWSSIYVDFRERHDVADRLMNTPQFGSRADFVPLQAADVIAHQMFQHIRDGTIEAGNIRECLRWSLGGVWNEIGLMGPQNLQAHERFLAAEGRL